MLSALRKHAKRRQHCPLERRMTIKEKVSKVVKLNIDTYKLKIDIAEEWLFSLPPSFSAIVSGALIGTATNLLTGLIFAQEVVNTTILLAISFLFLSSACFCIICVILEQSRAEVTGEGEATRKQNLRGEIHKRRTTLWRLFIGGLVSISSGIILIYCYSMRY